MGRDQVPAAGRGGARLARFARLLAALVIAASGARAERAFDDTFASLRPSLGSAYQSDRAAALDQLVVLARQEPAQRTAWLADPDPVVRRSAARVLARAPDPTLADDLRAAFLRETDPAVLDALVEALASLPTAVAELTPAIEREQDPLRRDAYARLIRGVACDALVGKLRNGRVPGFYDGQFASFWPLVRTMPEELLGIAYDDSYHLVVRTLAAMALAETRRPTLEDDLKGLVTDERLELNAMIDERQNPRSTALEILRRRAFVLSKYTRFSLAKAGQTTKLRLLIKELEEFLDAPRQRMAIAFRGDRSENASAWFWAEVLRDFSFDVGYFYQQFDDYASAEKRYVSLIRRFPESRACEEAQYNLACICAIQNRKQEALEHLRAAILCGFTDDHWLQEDGDLASIRGEPEFAQLVELARTGVTDDSGRDWSVTLQRFLPPGTVSFFDLGQTEQRDVLLRAAESLSPAQRRRLLEDAPASQRAALRALLGEPATDGR